MKDKFIIISTTYPNLDQAKNLAKILLEKKLAACLQFCQVESIYNWQEKVTENSEILVTIKTIELFYDKIEKIITEDHEYEVPEIISIPINQGSNKYLSWIRSNF
jgi:periplasmic divalent cation tolerance protein